MPSLPALEPWHLRPSAGSAAGQLWEGLAASWYGWRFLRRTPELWTLAIVPVLLAMLVSAIVIALVIALAVATAAGLQWLLAGGRSGWDWYAATAGTVVLTFLVAIGLCLAAFVFWKILTTIVCGYWFGRLADRAERMLGVAAGELAPVSTGAEFLGLLLSLTVLVVGSIVLLMIGFVPIVGAIVSLFGGILFTAWIMGLDYLGYPWALRGIPRWRQYKLARANTSHVIGLGLFVSVCELVPIIGAIPLTMAVLGAVLLARKTPAPARSTRRFRRCRR